MKDEGRCAVGYCDLVQLLVSGGCRGIRAVTIVCSRRPLRVECMVEVVVGGLRKDARR